jgi:hypothetical protein
MGSNSVIREADKAKHDDSPWPISKAKKAKKM